MRSAIAKIGTVRLMSAIWATVVFVPVLTACNGTSKSATVPNVVGQRLDVAESDLDDEGVKYEEIGGGTFGIIAKSNWTVCSTQPDAGSTASKVKLIVDRECASTAPGSGAVPTDTGASTPRRASRKSWRMPDLQGRNLQDAQDAIQRLTHDAIWYTHSHDATGADRGQWLDRDWKVCTQNIAPGQRIHARAKIDFGVVRVSEPCP